MLHKQLMNAIADGKAVEVVIKEVGTIAIGFIVIDFKDVISKGEVDITDAKGLANRLSARVDKAILAAKERERLIQEGLIDA